jgi:hypothetical protein
MNELLLVALLVGGILLVVRTREHLTATPTIKRLNITTTDSAELLRRAAITPEPLKSAVLAKYQARPMAGKTSDEFVGLWVGSAFLDPAFDQLYAPATAPLTEADIDRYLAARKTTIMTTPVYGRDTNEVVGYIDNGNAKTLLKSYFLQQSSASSPAGQAPPRVLAPNPTVTTPSPPNSDFTEVLGRYKEALLDAKSKGDTAAQARADTLRAWLDTQLQTTQARVNSNRASIQQFVDEYAGSTSEIEQVRQKFKEVRDRGPVLQDVYETDKKSTIVEQSTYNFSPLYSKSVLIVGLAVVAGLVWRRI